MINALKKIRFAAIASIFFAGSVSAAPTDLGIFDMTSPSAPYFINIASPMTISGPDQAFSFSYIFAVTGINASNGTAITATAIDGNGLASLELKLFSPSNTLLVDVIASPSATAPGTWSASFNYSPILADVGQYTLEVLGQSASTSQSAGYGGNMILAAIPEPDTYAMLLAGLCVVGFVAGRGKQNMVATA